MKSSLFPLVLVTLLLSLNPSVTGKGLLEPCSISSMYIFGDSVSDAGNAIVEYPNSYAGQFPNGMTIGKATGRFCDGLLIVDRIAESAGLPPTNPFENKSLNHSTGANFAVGGVGLLSKELRADLHVELGSSQSSLEVQLGWFDEFLREEPARADKIGSALFVLGGGGNDYASFQMNDSFFNDHPLRAKMLIMPYVIDSLKNGTKKVIQYGAKKIVLLGVYQGGCLPGTNESMLHVDGIFCSKAWNSYHELHNQLVQKLVRDLSKEFPDVRIVYGNIWSGVDRLFHNYRSLGFEHSNAVRCCGNASNTNCGSPGSHYMFWDGRHFTDHAYRVISDSMIPQIFEGLRCGGAPAPAKNLDEQRTTSLLQRQQNWS
ncbi:unnamed protein product [Linum trigynum]|uniref:GDSL esterase/lipase n=1 Tax=Linum trigynum TaxID=586398 RepID=A0AAV2EHV3_9ROSI